MYCLHIIQSCFHQINPLACNQILYIGHRTGWLNLYCRLSLLCYEYCIFFPQSLHFELILLRTLFAGRKKNAIHMSCHHFFIQQLTGLIIKIRDKVDKRKLVSLSFFKKKSLIISNTCDFLNTHKTHINGSSLMTLFSLLSWESLCI